MVGDFLHQTIELHVRSIGLHDLGPSCHIKYDYSGEALRESEETARFNKRAPQTLSAPGATMTQTLTNSSLGGFNTGLPPRTILFPPQSGNATLVPQSIIKYVTLLQSHCV